MNFVAIGCELNSALYLAACFIAGLAANNGYAVKLSIAAMGVTYLSYLAQMRVRPDCYADAPWLIANVLVVSSIILGASAGLALLF